MIDDLIAGSYALAVIAVARWSSAGLERGSAAIALVRAFVAITLPPALQSAVAATPWWMRSLGLPG